MDTNTTNKQFLKVGDIVTLSMPHSEVCMSMRVAGMVRPVLVVEGGAQILNHDGTKFSFPVTTGEAGIYTDTITGRLYVSSHKIVQYKPRPQRTAVLYMSRKVGDKVIECASQMAVQSVIERFGRSNIEVIYERDEMGRRCRVICSPMSSALLNPSPVIRLAQLAHVLHVPCSIED